MYFTNRIINLVPFVGYSPFFINIYNEKWVRLTKIVERISYKQKEGDLDPLYLDQINCLLIYYKWFTVRDYFREMFIK